MLLCTHNIFDIILNYASIYMQILKKKKDFQIDQLLSAFVYVVNDTKKGCQVNN